MSAPTPLSDDSVESLDSTPGQITTFIIDTHLRGPDRPVQVARLEHTAAILRVRMYTHVDATRDIWQVSEPDALTVIGGTVLASGQEGPVRIILSAVG